MKETIIQSRICPKCGKEYTEHPALSRMDNETLMNLSNFLDK